MCVGNYCLWHVFNSQSAVVALQSHIPQKAFRAITAFDSGWRLFPARIKHPDSNYYPACLLPDRLHVRQRHLLRGHGVEERELLRHVAGQPVRIALAGWCGPGQHVSVLLLCSTAFLLWRIESRLCVFCSRAHARSFQGCGAGTQISCSGSEHLNFFGPGSDLYHFLAPVPEQFGPENRKKLVQKNRKKTVKKHHVYNALASQTILVETQPKFQAPAPPSKRLWFRLHCPG